MRSRSLNDHTHSLRLSVLIGVLAAALVMLLASAPAADAANCKYSAQDGRKMGASYVTSIQSVGGASCKDAIQVVKAFHACRKANGGSKNGRCPARQRVRGYTCKEQRGKTYQGQFSSKVTCQSGSRRVVHTYSNFN